MPTPKRRSRPCEACRDRHLKCDVDETEGPCDSCKSADMTCKKAQKRLKFRDAKKSKTVGSFSELQPWVRTEARLEFRDVTLKVAEASDRHGVRAETVHQQPQEAQVPSEISAHASVDLSPTTIAATPSPTVEPPLVQFNTLPISIQEACLIRHFTAELAHSFDATDHDAHYALTIPHRALISPVVLYAICTVSSRLLTSRWYNKTPKPTIVHYDNVPLPDLNEHSAIHYHNACLRLLMDFADIPADEANAEARADALAATTILRTYEQLDTSLTGLDAEVIQGVVQTVMSKHHAVSIFSLDNMDKNNRDARGVLIPAEGLRTSACLVALRQEIWSVVMYRRPFRLPLEENMDYASLSPTDDFTWANRVILWCADVLRFCFGSSAEAADTHQNSICADDRWQALKVFDERWISDTPSAFQPLFQHPANSDKEHCFPVIWQINNAHVTAIQHLHLGRMLLALHKPQQPRIGVRASAHDAAIERELRKSVRVLCGLALGDTRFQSGMTTAAVGISIGGAFFEDSQERRAIVSFLEALENEHSWPTRAMVGALREAWGGAMGHENSFDAQGIYVPT
ncbi:hypothetical protein C7974DRAFT_90983 [Boeremia exigua]|uniref:uncharacterized protein n=1 Tax=Boeremia exigua TaxID=749465 RepID=UPI001E8DF855|nr:uncharacterized protein C7974DRAFT_90983 [Boeremia exigua]KAH6612087.1 hypothetical protein C7974DRAFT_90983 [Boeremia exigua]